MSRRAARERQRDREEDRAVSDRGRTFLWVLATAAAAVFLVFCAVCVEQKKAKFVKRCENLRSDCSCSLGGGARVVRRHSQERGTRECIGTGIRVEGVRVRVSYPLLRGTLAREGPLFVFLVEFYPYSSVTLTSGCGKNVTTRGDSPQARELTLCVAFVLLYRQLQKRLAYFVIRLRAERWRLDVCGVFRVGLERVSSVRSARVFAQQVLILSSRRCWADAERKYSMFQKVGYVHTT